MSWLYLGSLVLSVCGLGLLDYRHRLAIFDGQVLRTLITVAVGVVFFLGWDLVGIAHGVFFRGAGPYMTGVVIAPELPIEEVLFLTLLSYVLLLSYLAVSKRRA
jgi:lycopene cyclase domain-containing protein